MTKTKQQNEIAAPALLLQHNPFVYVVVLPGKWLLTHTTPSWRLQDPIAGFQRIVNEARSRAIARTVLDNERTFPNAITLASNVKTLNFDGRNLTLPDKTKFLVVDGQHRLWAQNFSNKEANYACIVHLDKSEKEMAELFLEINDNQKRVPSSLRWDLVRLVQPNGDESAIMASELVFELVERKDSPFYYAIDLTGEQKDVSIKQGSLAPEIKTLITKTKKAHSDLGFEAYAGLLIRFFTAVKSLDTKGWGDTDSTFYKARILRALLRVLTELILKSPAPAMISTPEFLATLRKIDPLTLTPEVVRAAQGTAGVTDLFQAMLKQVVA
ncbi:DGQHR domain-containing protein [Edaphobacter sp. DSM 109919]|uniref:DGQHR domain-containing protein n=1 Tax=Edaphobacter paludis TaxID=3035702 RepID=A0AAU7CTJ9_9BACT